MKKKIDQKKIVMDRFSKGRLRDPSGKTIEDPKQAVAVAYAEEERGKKQGFTERTFKGDKRRRPKKVG